MFEDIFRLIEEYHTITDEIIFLNSDSNAEAEEKRTELWNAFDRYIQNVPEYERSILNPMDLQAIFEVVYTLWKNNKQ